MTSSGSLSNCGYSDGGVTRGNRSTSPFWICVARLVASGMMRYVMRLRMRPAEGEVGVRLEHDLLPRAPGDEAEGPVSDRLARDRMVRHLSDRHVAQDVLGQRIADVRVDHLVHVPLVVGEPHGERVYRLHVGDVVEPAHRRPVDLGRPAHPDAEDDVVCRERLAVVPRDSGVDVERDLHRVLAERERIGEARTEMDEVRLRPHQIPVDVAVDVAGTDRVRGGREHRVEVGRDPDDKHVAVGGNASPPRPARPASPPPPQATRIAAPATPASHRFARIGSPSGTVSGRRPRPAPRAARRPGAACPRGSTTRRR